MLKVSFFGDRAREGLSRIAPLDNAMQNLPMPSPIPLPGRIALKQGPSEDHGGVGELKCWSMTPGEWPKHLYGHIPRRVLKMHLAFPSICFPSPYYVYMLFNVKPYCDNAVTARWP